MNHKSDAPVRIAALTGKWNGYGVETLLLEIARQLDQKRVNFTFLVDDDSQDVPMSEIRATGAGLEFIPPYQSPIRYRRHLVELFGGGQFDIVHAHISTMCVFPLWAAHAAGVPIRIAHVHTTASVTEWKKSALKQVLRPMSKIFATNLAASSISAAKWMYGKSEVEAGRVYYLPVARDLNKFRYDPLVRALVRAELNIEDRFVIGHLGRFVPQKNHMFLLRTFQQVLKLRPDALLLLAGDGPLVSDTLAQAKALGCLDSVMYLGLRNDAPRLYQAMDVFVLPSLYEGVPGTGVEAQAAGLPFIYSDSVTDEINLLTSTVRKPLRSGPAHWAETVVAAGKHVRSDNLTIVNEAGYGSRHAAEQLTKYYEKLMNNSGSSNPADANSRKET